MYCNKPSLSLSLSLYIYIYIASLLGICLFISLFGPATAFLDEFIHVARGTERPPDVTESGATAAVSSERHRLFASYLVVGDAKSGIIVINDAVTDS